VVGAARRQGILDERFVWVQCGYAAAQLLVEGRQAGWVVGSWVPLVYLPRRLRIAKQLLSIELLLRLLLLLLLLSLLLLLLLLLLRARMVTRLLLLLQLLRARNVTRLLLLLLLRWMLRLCSVCWLLLLALLLWRLALLFNVKLGTRLDLVKLAGQL
jgi:hypothetical protein